MLRLREEYPRWGKDKLVVFLRGEGFHCSTSTVDKILHKLKGHVAGVTRDIVEVDTLD